MEYKTKVKPSKASSITLIIFGVLFLIFGIVFLSSVSSELSSDEGGPLIIMFFVIWMVMCIGFVIYGAINLTKKDGITAYNIDIDKVGENVIQNEISIESRLKNLESVKQNRLITEEEYQKKRKEILDEKW